MKALQVRPLSEEEITELDELYRKTKEARIRTRVQMILLAAEEQLAAPEIAKIVRKNDQTVRRWIRRFNMEGTQGLYDAPRSGSPGKTTSEYRERLLIVVRQRPRSLDQPYSLWTLDRLADFMAEETGVRVSYETVRRILKKHGIVFRRPQHTISSPDPEYQVKKRRLKSKEPV
jgi:transposase